MILVHGAGVTALACERLLTARGISVARTAAAEPGGPPLLIRAETLDLLAEIFGDETLREVGHPVPRRIVVEPNRMTTVEAPARAIWSSPLVARLSENASSPVSPESRATVRLDATGRRAYLAEQIAGIRPTLFGRRHVVSAQLSGSSSAAVLELTEVGWLFLFPISKDQVVVQAMLPSAPQDPQSALDSALAMSRLIRKLTDLHCSTAELVAAAPQILPVIGSDRWLAVGAAAFAVDPICGDGTGMALHSARLAAAVVSSVGKDGTGIRIDHYHKRHQRAFLFHLRETTDIYQPLLKNTAWATELRDTETALKQPNVAALVDASNFSFQLADGALVLV